jgi:hypothetical protein
LTINEKLRVSVMVCAVEESTERAREADLFKNMVKPVMGNPIIGSLNISSR